MNTGILENLELTIAGISIFVHAWIVNKAPYCLLLGQPFQMAVQCDTEDVGETLIVFDPKKPGCCVWVPMTPHHSSKHHQMPLFLTAPSSLPVSGPLGMVRTLSLLSANLPMAVHYLKTVYDCMTPALGLKYKPVA